MNEANLVILTPRARPMDVVASRHSRGHLSILQVNCEKINLDIALDDAQVQLTDRNFTNEKYILRNTSFMLIW